MRAFKRIFLLLFIFSCASKGEFRERNVNTGPRFCYVNLNIIVEYMINNDPDAMEVKKRKEDIIQKIDSINKQLADIDDKIDRDEYIEKQKNYNMELAELKTDEEHYKNRILNQIDRALENIAKKSDIDFIFNIGEGAVYAKKEYDITEEVLREIIRQKERSSPVSR